MDPGRTERSLQWRRAADSLERGTWPRRCREHQGPRGAAEPCARCGWRPHGAPDFPLSPPTAQRSPVTSRPPARWQAPSPAAGPSVAGCLGSPFPAPLLPPAHGTHSRFFWPLLPSADFPHLCPGPHHVQMLSCLPGHAVACFLPWSLFCTQHPVAADHTTLHTGSSFPCEGRPSAFSQPWGPCTPSHPSLASSRAVPVAWNGGSSPLSLTQKALPPGSGHGVAHPPQPGQSQTDLLHSISTCYLEPGQCPLTRTSVPMGHWSRYPYAPGLRAMQAPGCCPVVVERWRSCGN